MQYSEQLIEQYSKSLSESERQHCESTIRVFENILQKYGFEITKKNYDKDDSENLNYRYHIKKGKLEFTIFLQGSYGNGTCVRQDSDVDIVMICESTFIGKFPEGKSGEDYYFIASDFNILEFKEEFYKFIKTSNFEYKVENHSKCIFFEGNNSSRKDMDIVTSLRYRDYSKDYFNNRDNFVGGSLIVMDNGKEIINYPEQSRINSTVKNKATKYYYKKVVRILKKIKNDMIENAVEGANMVSSYGLECMIYNVPNSIFNSECSSLKKMTYNVVDYLCKNTFLYSDFLETNGILKIFDNTNNNKEVYEMLLNNIKKYLEE